jgi:hypothetical protein
MLTRLIGGLLLGLALASPPQPVRAYDLEASTAAGKKLLAEGDTLADKGETTEAVLRYKQAFEQILPGMRRIHFKHEVKRDVTAREDLRELLLKEIDEDMPAEEFRGNELGMKALGLIPRDLNLKEVMVRVYTEEIAAFYDPKTKTMHLIREPEAKSKKGPSLLERLLGKTGGFDKDENKIVIAHELTHALADQNFDIEAMHQAVKGDDDRDLALAALIEGEATLTMFGAQMSDWNGSKIAGIPASRWDGAIDLMSAVLPMGSGPSLREAPPIITESMIFPYMRGMVYCAWLTNAHGWEALNDAYRNPPLSTEQILHPEKYRKDPDPPTAIDFVDLEAPEGWKEAGTNVVGEMQLGVLLRRHGGRPAAAGWDGDRFTVFEGPADRLGLVWFSTWDSEEQARRFAGQYSRFQTTKLGPDIPEPDVFPDAIRRPHKGAVFAVERRGPDVAIVEGFPSPATESLVEAAFKARKTEKTQASVARPKKRIAAAEDKVKTNE